MRAQLNRIVLGEQGLLVIFVIAFAIVAATVPNFLTERNILGLLQSVVTIGIVACTMMLCLASRDFDLSVGSTVAFAGMISVMASNATGSIVLGLLAALICGSIVGAFNGVVIAKFKINALITTLATMQMVRGLALIASDGRAIGINDPNFYQLALSRFFTVPTRSGRWASCSSCSASSSTAPCSAATCWRSAAIPRHRGWPA